jgi:hypothetical protein
LTVLTEFYEIFAEISVAFAGFAGVVGAFSKFRVVPEAIALRVRFLVSVALTVLIGSILPPVLLALQISDTVTIRVSALFLDLCITLLAVYAWRELRPLQRAGLIRTQFITAVLYAIGIPFIFALAVVAAGGWAAHAAQIYLAALAAGLVSCCWYFIQLMFTVDIGRRD